MKPEFQKWASSFYENGFLILENALSETVVNKIKNDLRVANEKAAKYKNNKKKLSRPGSHIVHKPFFEHSQATVEVIGDSVLSDFADYVIADVPSSLNSNRPNPSTYAHVFHNNAYSIPAKQGRGQANVWHTDDPLQNVILPEGVNLPKNVRLPVLAMTYMIWLSDCISVDNGPTHVIPGSHRFGKPIPSHKDARAEIEAKYQIVCATGKAGTAVLINNQLWHRGARNVSEIARDTLQISYGRRIIGHKYKTIMNYQMPDRIWKNKSEKVKRRLGFLQGGAYS